jgi:mRNA-degrading endonuclease RelE of RelBE toxin-antitoxin system
MKVALSKDAEKQYKHLPKNQQAKVFKKLVEIEQNPYVGKRLEGELSGTYSLRAWPYRILYEISKNKQIIEVHKIAHRQGAYK